MSKKVEEKYYLCVETSQYSYTTRSGDVHDEWDRDDTDTNWDFGDIYFELGTTNRKSYGDLDIIVSKEDAEQTETYAVIAVWSTGDSFGHDSGRCAEIISVHHDYDEANNAKETLEGIGEKDKNVNKIPLGNGYFVPGYVPWFGYFESLCYVTVIGKQNSGSIYKKMLTNIVKCYNEGDDYGLTQEIEKAEKTLNL